MNSPWLSFSGTGSAPRRSTQQGIFPLANWYGANHSRNSRTGSVMPSRSSADEVRAASRIQERAYAREPGWMAALSRLMRMYATDARMVWSSVLTIGGPCRAKRLVLPRHSAAARVRDAAAQTGSAPAGSVPVPCQGTAIVMVLDAPGASDTW